VGIGSYLSIIVLKVDGLGLPKNIEWKIRVRKSRPNHLLSTKKVLQWKSNTDLNMEGWKRFSKQMKPQSKQE
jgi:hypothetical protein